MPDLESHYSFRHTLDYHVARLCNRTVWIDYYQGQYELFMVDFPHGKPEQVLTSATGYGKDCCINRYASCNSRMMAATY